MYNRYSTLVIFLFLSMVTFAQNGAQSQRLTIEKKGTINLSEITEDWRVKVHNHEFPHPGGDSYKSFLLRQKSKIKPNGNRSNDINGGSLSNPYGLDTMNAIEGFIGNAPSLGASQPNDHSMAISNDGLIVSTHNSNITCFNSSTKEEILNISLTAFGEQLDIIKDNYDPKVIYDPAEDRFVLVFLDGRDWDGSNIFVAFSATNDPSKEWHYYLINGNPFPENHTWSDYPAISLSKDEFYITMNMVIGTDTVTNIRPTWQTGFGQSVIYQIDKKEAYNGGDVLDLNLWSNIKFDDKRIIRNIHPVKGGSQLYGPEMYFLSNNNFSLENDSIFVIKIDNSLDNAPSLSVSLAKSNISYGMPPNGRKKLEDTVNVYYTNDSRVLGAFIENNQIQFVQNSVIPSTGQCGVYHGIIPNVSSGLYAVEGRLIGDTIDFGYPNISYAGTGEMNDAIITFLHTGPHTLSGMSAVFFKHKYGYHPRKIIKKGEKLTSNSIKRWGDYSGSQRKYNESGVVWCSGSFGAKKVTGTMQQTYDKDNTWIAALESPDKRVIQASIEEEVSAQNFRSYPTVTYDIHTIEFEVEAIQKLTISVIDVNGKLVKILYKDAVKGGTNSISFATNYLAKGSYFLNIRNDREELYNSRFIVQ